MIELLAAFFAGAALTAVFGAPIAARAAQPHRFRRPTKAGHAHTNKVVEAAVRPFAPLDLGPDLTKWPSQAPWTLAERLEPDWPSKQWNDEHFGAHWRREGHAGKVAAAAAAAAPESPGSAAPKAAKAPAQPSQGRRRKAAPAPAPAAAAPAAQRKAGPPSDAEIEHLIATEGLAGTVQVIMARTGWDFREAAQYLNQLRKGR